MLIRIESLYCSSSISMHLKWKKWKNQLTGPFLPAGPSLAKRGLKSFGSVLRYQMMFFGGKMMQELHKELSHCVRIMSIGVRMQKLCHSEADLPIFTPIVREDDASAPIIHGKGASHVFVM